MDMSDGIHGGYLVTFLFPGTSTTTKGSFIVGCLCTMTVAFLMEMIKFSFRKYQENKTHLKLVTCEICHNPSNYLTFPTYNLQTQSSYPEEGQNEENIRGQSHNNLVAVTDDKICYRKIGEWVILGSGQFFISLASLLLMLLAMTMNIYILLSLAFGTACGHVAIVFHQQKDKIR